MFYDPSVKLDSTRTSAQRALFKAADWIESYGWCWHQLVSPDSRHRCVMGAVVAVEKDATIQDSAFHLFEKRVGQRADLYNDAEGRTKEQVVTALRTAAL